MKKVRVKDLASLVEHTQKRFIQMPTQVRIVGGHRTLSDGERMALCYLEAALTVLGSMGVETADVIIEYDDSVHDPV